MDIRTGRHVVFMIHAHLVFTTKKRGKVLSSQHLDRLKEIFAAICVDFEAELREFNGERDHVHLLVNYPPKVRLSELVNSLKGVSSRRLKQEFPAIQAFWSVRNSRGVLVCRGKAQFLRGCKSLPARVAPAGSNRSRREGNDPSEAFDGKGR